MLPANKQGFYINWLNTNDKLNILFINKTDDLTVIKA